jgi:hypothetical protein
MALPDNPLTRGEQYLNRIATGEGTIPDEPLTRFEQYLDYIAKNGGSSEPIEEIRTYTCDGTEGTFSIDEDNDGNPYRLKRAIVITTLGTVSASGTHSFTLRNGSTSLAEGYMSYSASATGQKSTVFCDQDGGYWRDIQSAFSGSFGALSINLGYLYNKKVEDYQYIDSFRLTRAAPAGTVIKILGVRV